MLLIQMRISGDESTLKINGEVSSENEMERSQ